MKMTPRWHTSRYSVNRDIGFGPYRLTKDGELQCPDGARIQLSARLGCILFELAVNNGAAVSRLDLIEHCWPGDEIAEDNLTRAIADLRKIFRAHGRDCIETVYGLGYRLNTGQSDYDFRDKVSFCKEAWQRVYQRHCASLNSAEDLFTQVVKMDESHLNAWLGIAETQFHRMQLCYTTTVDSAPQASHVLDRALDLDPACADALALKGLLLTWAEWDFAGAEVVLKRACELDPNAYIPNQATAWHKLAIGEFESAENHARAATAARPLSVTARAVRAFALLYMGDTNAALNVTRETVRIDSLGALSLALGAIFEAASGATGKAVSMAEQSFELLPESPLLGAILAYALTRDGLVDEARALLESKTKSEFVVGSNSLAVPAWIELGETGRALEALQSGFANRCTWLLPMLNYPSIDCLNCEPIKAAIFK